MDRRLYPANWDELARSIKDAANWQCENCGRPCRKPGETLSDFEERIAENFAEPWGDDLYENVEDEEFGFVPVLRDRRFVLTVAHLNHRPEDCRPENLRAWCNPCHGRYDLAATPLKKRLKAERNGQLTLGV